MKPRSFMIVAGEASGDRLAGDLVRALRKQYGELPPFAATDYQPLATSLEPRFFGAGGIHMRETGVEIALDLTAHSVTGISDVLKKVLEFRRFLLRLRDLARERQPDVIICVDFSGFNLRLVHAIRSRSQRRTDWFHDWNPKIVQFVSPQVWASREGRASQMAEELDLLLSIFPFEKQWYAARVPKLRVEFVGHPVLERYSSIVVPTKDNLVPIHPRVLLLPGSRSGELKRHLPVILATLKSLRAALPGLSAQMVLANAELERQAKQFQLPPELQLQIGNLPAALCDADVAIASTGTVTMECAYFRVPTVALYKTSRLTYEVAKRVVKVSHIAMPNLLAKEEIFPEFIQEEATPKNLANAALSLLQDPEKRRHIKDVLGRIIGELGQTGATDRAARLIMDLAEKANTLKHS